jgi:glycosyltransferase involved in cell wall biosynthesis
LYAERYLKQIRIQTPQRFIHNVIQLPDFEERNFEEKDIDFLWVNSLKDFRKVDWFLNALKSPELKHSKAVLLGLTDVRKDEAIYKMQIEMLAQKPNNLEVVPYTSPQEFYRRSRYFILPTSLVFLNNALLEAMSYGVVPIITNAEGSDLVIDNRKNGFISAFTEESFKAVMIECSAINKTDYQRLSREAIEKTKSAFSPAYYENQLMKMYSELEK